MDLKEYDKLSQELFMKTAMKDMENSLEPIGQLLAGFLDKYSLIFKHDKEMLISILIDVYLKKYDISTNSFVLDKNQFMRNVPKDTVDQMVTQLLLIVGSKVGVSELFPEEQPEKEIEVEGESEDDEPFDKLDFN